MRILGLAVATSEHHAAALVVDGQVVAAAEEERFNRIKHFGARPRSQPHANLLNNPTLTLADVLCPHATRYVLQAGGVHLRDVDAIAINGIPAALIPADSAPLEVVTKGRYHFVPHHLAHAASAARIAGWSAAQRGGRVLTMDGRGERETAALFEWSASGELSRLAELPVGGAQNSLGGCYETLSRQLGFGPHGQGAAMALAALGRADERAAPWLGGTSWSDAYADEQGLWAALSAVQRASDAPIEPIHTDWAASVQFALERTLGVLLGSVGGALALAGGVALNCPANRHLAGARVHRGDVFVTPAAHDAGTAVGAALEVAYRLGEPACAPWNHAAWGPEASEDQMEQALRRAGYIPETPANVAEAVAARLAEGRIVCRFAGRMEFGPRALGQRSILADPRRAELRVRLNAMKSRAAWRPFGPSILAGAEPGWLEDAFDSPFMLFTQTVLPERRAEIPVVVHGDGSTRPQSVHPGVLADFAHILRAFDRATGVPMVVNTSFNRGGEPIVCTPEDAVSCFRGLGADSLQMGPFLIDSSAR